MRKPFFEMSKRREAEEFPGAISNRFQLSAAEEKLNTEAQHEEAVCIGKEARLPALRRDRNLIAIVWL
jgi:hypothetical protein